MTDNYRETEQPLVTVMMSTYNRPQYVREAVDSVLGQTYRNFEFIAVRDGGADLSAVLGDIRDERFIFIDRNENHGKPFSLNQAIQRARGKYVCYIDDDDIFYPHHIETLVEALEGQDEYQVAYTDLYKAHCRVEPDGKRVVLSKNVEIARDFDRFSMFLFNHVLHVSLMHRRDLFEKTGPYNEKLTVMIDWDIARKLTFFSDFKHVPEVTGQYYGPVGDCDRISIKQRKSTKKYIMNLLAIRTTRPEKPWPKSKDVSMIVLADHLNEQLKQQLLDIWSHTFHPYRIYLPLTSADLDRLKTSVPNITGVKVSVESSFSERVDAAIKCCDGDYIAIVPANFNIVPLDGKDSDDIAWLEKSVNALMNSEDPTEAFELVGSRDQCWAAIFTQQQLKRAREFFGHLPVKESVLAAGIKLREPKVEEYPFQLDNLITCAEEAAEKGDYKYASQIYDFSRNHYQNDVWMMTRCANELYYMADYENAARLAFEINAVRPTVSTLVIEARARRQMEDYGSAIKLFEKAEDILESSSCGSLKLNKV